MRASWKGHVNLPITIRGPPCGPLKIPEVRRMLYTIAEAAKATGLEESIIFRQLKTVRYTALGTSQANGTSRTQNCIHRICPLHSITANIIGKQIYKEATEGVRN